jgi:hypothetical protein
MKQSNILAENLIRFNAKNLNESNLDKLKKISTDEGLLSTVTAPIRMAQNAVEKLVNPDQEQTKGKVIAISKYAGSIINIVKKLMAIDDTVAREEFTSVYCTDAGPKPALDAWLTKTVTPISDDMYDVVIKIQRDENLSTPKDAIIALHRAYEGPGVTFILGAVRAGLAAANVAMKFAAQDPRAKVGAFVATREVIDKFYEINRSKLGEEGRLLNSLISDMFGRIDMEYMPLCSRAISDFGNTMSPTRYDRLAQNNADALNVRG